MTIKTDGIFKDHYGNREIQLGKLNFITDTGSLNAYHAVLDPPIHSYETGLPVQIRAGSTCTGACTLEVNNLGAIAIKKNMDEDLEAGDIESGMMVEFQYDGTYFQLVSQTATMESRIQALENTYVKCVWFSEITEGTSGTLTPPTGGTIVLNQWEGGVDALATTLSAGIPTYDDPETSGGVAITATLDGAGHWTLSGTPSAYPVGIIYSYVVSISDFDYTKTVAGLEVSVSNSYVNSVNGMHGDVVIDIPEAGTDFLTPDAIALAYEPIVTAPTENPGTKFWNGEKGWTEIVVGAVGYSALVYPTNTDSTIVGTYKQASSTNDVSETTRTIAVTSAADVLSEEFLYENTLQLTTVNPGKWYFNFYAKVGTVVGVTKLRFDIFVRDTVGNETVLLSVYSEPLTASYERIEANYIGTPYTVNLTDRMGVKVYGSTTSVPERTISYIVGGVNGSYLTTPLALRHSQLRDKNGESSYQHVSSTEKGYLAQATEAAMGVAELATTAEAVAGTNDLTIITPSTLTDRLASPGPIGGTTPDAVTATYFYGDGGSITGVGSTTPASVSFYAYADVALKKGQAVYITSGSSAMPDVAIADNTNSAKCRVAGVAANDANIGATVLITRYGLLSAVDTTSSGYVNNGDETWAEGDLLFLTTGGWLTKTRPTSGRSVKVAYSTKGNNASDNILVIPLENPIWSTSASGESPVIRMGDDIGATVLSFRNYSNTEVASVDSYGYLRAPRLYAKDGNGLGLYDDGGTGIFIKDGGTVGVNNSNPTFQLDVSTATIYGLRVKMTASSSSSGGAVATMATDDGAALSSGDRFGTWYFSGTADGTGNLVNAVSMSAYATADWTAGNRGSRLTFEGTSDGASGRVAWATLRNARLGVGNIDPAYALDITGEAQVSTNLITPKVKAVGANGLSLQDDGNNGIFIKDGGDVGIGTVSPLSKLDINTGTFTLRETDTVYNQVVSVASGLNFNLNAGLANVTRSFVWSTSTTGGAMTQRMELSGAGYLGIGKASPTYGIDISKPTVSGIRIENTAASSSSAGSGIRSLSNDGAAMASGDRLGYYIFGGSYDSTPKISALGGMYSYTTENWSATNLGSDLRFYAIKTGTSSSSLMLMLKDNNVTVGGSTAAGTSGDKVLVMVEGTSPTTTATDSAQMWSANVNSVAAMNRLHTRTEDGVSGPLAIKNETDIIDSSKHQAPRIYQGGHLTVPAFKTVSNSTLSLGTKHSFSLMWVGSSESLSTSADRYFFWKHDGTNGIKFGIQCPELLPFVIINSTTYTCDIAADVAIYETHHFAVCVLRENSTDVGSVTFYLDGYQIGSSQAIDAGSPTTITCTSDLFVSGTDTARGSGSTTRAAIYNRHLSADEVLLDFQNGPTQWDMWGTCVSSYTSDFSAGNDSWGATRSTRTGNVDSIAGVDDCLSVYASSHASTSHYISRATTIPNHQNCRVTLDYYIPAGNTHVDGIRVGTSSGDDWTVVGTWTTDSKVINYTNQTILIYALDGSTTTFTGAGSASDDLFYIKNVSIEPLGVIAEYNSFGIQPAAGHTASGGSQWLDSSGNGNHLIQPTGAAPAKVNNGTDFEIRWTNTWAGTHEAQYIGGYNSYILPLNAYITDIIGVISGATIEDVIVGDGSDTDRFVAITTGLAAGIKTFTIANNTTDGTNYKMVVDPDANFTGSIAWTIKGFILEA